MTKHEKLGNILADNKMVSKENIEICLKKQKASSKPLGEILVEEGLITEEQLTETLAHQLGFTFVNLRQISVTEEALNTIPEDLAKHYQVLPIKKENHSLTIALSDPLNMTLIDDLSLLTGCDIEIVVAPRRDIEWGINRYYLPHQDFGQLEVEQDTNSTDLDPANDGPTILFVESMISKAHVMGASDIHIEPHEKEVIVRYRIDGILYDMITVPSTLKDSVVSRLKINQLIFTRDKVSINGISENQDFVISFLKGLQTDSYFHHVCLVNSIGTKTHIQFSIELMKNVGNEG